MISASSIIETVVAITIIVIVFFIVMMTLTSVTHSHSYESKMNVEFVLHDVKSSALFTNKTNEIIQYHKLRIAKETTLYRGQPNLNLVILKAFNTSDKLLGNFSYIEATYK